MTKQPKVSVIIPVYNTEKYLRQCLDSVVSQTLRDIEIICIDDGSTDSSPDILCEYATKDSRIKILRQKNLYAGVARNNGMAAATGEYLCFLDSDDWFEADMLEKAYCKAKSVDADMVIWGGESFNDATKQTTAAPWLLNLSLLPDGCEVFSHDDIPERFFSVTSPVPWTKLFKADFIASAGIKFQALRNVNDLFFTYSALALAKSITFVDEHFVHYRTNNGQSLVATKSKSPSAILEALLALKGKLIEIGVFNSLEHSFINMAADNCAYNLRTMSDDKAYKVLGTLLCRGGFNDLGMSDKPREFFYNGCNYDECMKAMVFQPKISVLIPVYNTEKYLRQCMDSVICQTMSDIEIICVDDGSTDGSADILREYAQKDNRVKIVWHAQNKKLPATRKDAVLQANGRYIWFVDSDDMIAADACEKAYELAERQKTDILQFNSEVINAGGFEEQRMQACRDFIKPYRGRLEGGRVFTGCFEKRLFNFTIWNKLFDAKLCKKAFGFIEELPVTMGDDKYLFFALAYFAESYYGEPDLCLYKYRFGAGESAKNVLSRALHTSHCKMAMVADAAERFLEAQGEKEKYKKLLENSRSQLLCSCVGEWNCRCPREDKAWGYAEMLRYWEPEEVVAEIARLNWNNKRDIAAAIKPEQTLSQKLKKAKRIGVYYHHLSIGGAQRVTADLIWLWRGMGYECVLITDLKPDAKNDYKIPPDVPRVVIPSYFSLNAENYKQRAQAWADIIREHDIDTVVYHSWMADCLLWDMMVVKALNASVVIHCHSVFSYPLHFLSSYWGEMPDIYSLADVVVTLGKADRLFWQQFNKRVYMVVNPNSIPVGQIPQAKLKDKKVVWVGRISGEKRPMDCVEIAAKVAAQIPEVKFCVVGDSENDSGYLKRLKKRANQLGIQDNISFEGFKQDIEPYYLDSSVFLMTSAYEGFCLTLFEAKSYGLPCVMYELPYLLLAENNRGIIPVKMGDTTAAAAAIIRLLNDESLRRDMGEEARGHMIEINSFDHAAAWREIFDSLGEETADTEDFERRIMWNALLEHYRMGTAKQMQERYMLTKQVDELKTQRQAAEDNTVCANFDLNREISFLRSEIAAIHCSWTYRLGSLITLLPRIVRRVYRCYREHGFGYTLSRAKARFPELFKGWRF